MFVCHTLRAHACVQQFSIYTSSVATWHASMALFMNLRASQRHVLGHLKLCANNPVAHVGDKCQLRACVSAP
eukprot:1160825-Pelagomonas_calceolata.AAC.3